MATLNLSPLRVSLRPSLSPPHTQQRFIGQVPGTLLITRDVTVSKTGKVPELTEMNVGPGSRDEGGTNHRYNRRSF